MRLTPRKTTNTNSNNKTSNTDTTRRFMLTMLIIGRLLGHHYEPVNNKAPTTKELDWSINPTRMKDKLETKMEDFFNSEKECEDNKITETNSGRTLQS